MKLSVRKGFGFGLTSGIITTLGLMVGLNSSTHSALVVIGGIIVIAIADSLSDALGIHISEEAESKHTSREIWESTLSTFLTKFLVALSFIVFVFLLPLQAAILASVIYGLALLGIFSYFIAKREKIRPYRAVTEHLIIAIFVIIVTDYAGSLVSTFI